MLTKGFVLKCLQRAALGGADFIKQYQQWSVSSPSRLLGYVACLYVCTYESILKLYYKMGLIYGCIQAVKSNIYNCK